LEERHFGKSSKDDGEMDYSNLTRGHFLGLRILIENHTMFDVKLQLQKLS